MTWSVDRLMIGLLAVLTVVLALEWLLPDAAPPALVPPPRPHVLAATADAPARDTSAWVGAILARPIFSISRRPPRVTRGSHPDQVAGEARLAGIMITRSGRRAIFAPEGGGHPLVLAEGASVNQSTLRGIFADHVVLASGAVLRPTYDRNRPTTGTQIFQPAPPGFPNPGFPNPGFPNPGFPNPNFPNFGPGALQPGYQPPVPVPQAGNDDGGPPQVPPQPPVFRGNLIPQRRE